MRFAAPSGAVIDAREGAEKRLLAAGFSEIADKKPAEKTEPKPAKKASK